MIATTEPEMLMREGIAAAHSGDKAKTRELMQQVTELDPQNQSAWLWRANSAESPEESLDCLRNAIALIQIMKQPATPCLMPWYAWPPPA